MKSNEMKNAVAVSSQGAGAKTLRQLGIDGGLAADFEHAFRMMGAVQGEQVVGFTFATPDGQRHPLRVERADGQPELSRAA